MSEVRRYIFGEWQRSRAPLTVKEAEEVCFKASQCHQKMRALGHEKIFQILSDLKNVWKNPESKYRKLAEATLPEMTGFSQKMIRLGLDELAETLSPEILELKVKTEFGSIPRFPLKNFDPETGRFLCFEPLGTLFHVLSGNVFLVGPGSLLEGVLTGNVNIFKMSSSDTFFLPLFIESLEEVDTESVLVSNLAVLDLSSRETEVLEVFKRSVDGVVVWGGEEAAQSFRQGLPARVRFVMFGPKLSFALVTKQGIKTLGIEEVAKSLATELVIWDQNACTAPQLCFVEGKEERNCLAEKLSQAIQKLSEEFPAGRPSADTAAEIRKLRGVQEVSEARSLGKLFDSGASNLDFTILIEEDLKFETSPLHRTLRVMSYESINEIVTLTQAYKGYLQTVGVAGTNSEILEIEEKLGLCGAQRILPLGQMSGGAIDDPHDGAYDLPQLMNLVVGRLKKGELDTWDLMPQDKRYEIQNERFLRVLRSARNTDFYQKALERKSLNLSLLSEVPLLDRSQWEKNMFPKARVLQSRENLGGYVTRSGGSTGAPKFSYFDKLDWKNMVQSAVRMFRSCGFEPRDRIANLMSAGDLYGSFISFDHVCFELGAQLFALGGQIDSKVFYELADQFKINTLIGFPPKISSLLRDIKSFDPNFTLEKIMYAGQPMSPADQKFLREECGVQILCSVIGSTESNHIAYQCQHLSGNRFHLAEDYNWIEILDEEGQSLPIGSSGRIAVTNLQKTNYPVLRFLIGDSGRILPELCSCGRQDRVLEYLGRTDDILCIGVMNVGYNDVVRALEPYSPLGVQLVGSFFEGKDRITIKIESANPSALHAQEIVQYLIKNLSEFQDHLDRGTFDLKVEILESGKIPRQARTGKIRGIVDER